ncbi:MAG: hypothetical protein U5R30_20750 [Deltaproteobacteria bacterium]|nr:hypothetical protein [Deltaproteobacteria bacterium]
MKQLVRGRITCRSTLRTDPSCEGGVRVATRDNRLLFDNSFAARLKRGEHEIRQEIWSDALWISKCSGH